MTTNKNPRDLTADEADALVAAFDDHTDDEYSVTDAATLRELRAAAAARREADARIEAAALAAAGADFIAVTLPAREPPAASGELVRSVVAAIASEVVT